MAITNAETTKKSTKPPLKSWFTRLPFVEGLLLLAALAGAWLPGDWTLNLKRIQQPNWYIGLGLAYLVVYVAAAWLVMRRPEAQFRGKWLSLAILVLLPNLLNIWVRYSFEYELGKSLFGRDADVGLFYKYGHDFATGQTPTFNGNYMEYPQFALFLFWVAERLAGGVQQSFYWVFPAWMLFWQAVAAAALYATGLKLQRGRAAWLLAAFTAGCPYLYLFNYTRFDIAPAAMLLVAVYFFLPSPSKEGYRSMARITPRHGVGSGLATATGFLTKWLPAIIVPWFVAAYVQTRRWRELAIFTVSGTLLAVVVMLPFYLANSEAFWYPYKFQGGRKLIGESFWFLLQYHFFDPAHSIPEKPWGEPASVILGNNKLLVAQLGLVAVVFGLTLWRLWRKGKDSQLYARWAAAGLVAVAVFTLGNRIFSPQYLVLLVWVWAMALVLRPVTRVGLAIAFGLMLIASGANFLVFLLGVWPEEWLKYSLFLFAASWGLSGWLLWQALSKVEDEGGKGFTPSPFKGEGRGEGFNYYPISKLWA